jgi:4-oxalocrotonate tautomerase
MPLVQVTMVEGRTVEQKHALIRKLTDAVVDALGTEASRVRVAIYEVSPDEWGIGGEPVSKVRPTG